MSTIPLVRLAGLAAATSIVFALAGQPSQAAGGHGTHSPSTTSSSMNGHGDGHAISAPASEERDAHSGRTQRRTIDLTVDRVEIDAGGFSKRGVGFNGASPGPVLRFKEGEEVTIRVTNTMDVPTSIHWHGLILPYQMDGVPTISYDGIAPGETFTYRFPIQQAGTYWYHSHSGFQEPDGAYGAIVIEPKDGPRHAVDRDYVVQLTDAHPHSGDRVMRNLKMMPDYYNRQQRTLFDFLDDVGTDGLDATLAERGAWGDMRMMPTDIEDVQGYTPLINGRSPENNWTALFEPGERVRMRLINSSAMAYFDVRIPGLKMTVIQADGNDVEPVAVDELRIAVAETYDVIVEPTEARAYTIFAESMGRSTFARGTLAPKAGMTADVPALREPPLLTMADMGMAHGDMGQMDHGDMSGQMLHDTAQAAAARLQAHGAKTGKPEEHGGAAPAMERAVMSSKGHGTHGGHDGTAGAGQTMAGPSHGSHTTSRAHGGDGMDHGKPAVMTETAKPTNSDAMADGDMDHTRMHQVGMEQPAMDHGAMDHGVMGHAAAPADGDPFYAPGSGLTPKAANGGRVLSYADLRAARPLYADRPANREIELRLTGNMERYIWSVNGVKYGEAEPIRLQYGERVRFKFVNETMMTHPMHLHGMWSIVDVGAGRLNPIKHVVSVAPGTTVYMETEVDAPGAWAFHCHLSYHAAAGMFRKVVVEGAPQTAQLGGQ
jgi:CopA family copper-resistance protein